ncbi:MAG: DUF4160 domain-containing protein [Schwartzia sp.]|nr:DUF4160 domain-containing protein [Schwartzia sp. (in: firmicutes)]MBR1760964.1 DUF4160 domain-containing protein [Schwartzia sp. (in: firmicutes)]MBR1885029.1 DUF4160 domain-containing protein [Schwartzia sp. (in: firmicutes)]
MPIVKILGGIIIRMHHERNERHHSAHVHVEYGEYDAVYDLGGNVLEGGLPTPQHREIVRWMDANREAIMERWEQALRFLPIDRI